MTDHIDLEKRLLAAAMYELRILLAGHIDPDDNSPVSAAAWLAYLLHNQALAALEGKPFDVRAALDGLGMVERRTGSRWLQHFRQVVLSEA